MVVMFVNSPHNVYFRLVVRKRNIEFQIDESHSAKLSSWLNAIGQFIFQYCVTWTTNLKFTVPVQLTGETGSVTHKYHYITNLHSHATNQILA